MGLYTGMKTLETFKFVFLRSKLQIKSLLFSPVVKYDPWDNMEVGTRFSSFNEVGDITSKENVVMNENHFVNQ